MANCKLCTEFDDCPFRVDPDVLCGQYEQKPMTNADIIRSSSDEEPARMLSKDCNETIDIWLKWLRQEVAG